MHRAPRRVRYRRPRYLLDGSRPQQRPFRLADSRSQPGRSRTFLGDARWRPARRYHQAVWTDNDSRLLSAFCWHSFSCTMKPKKNTLLQHWLVKSEPEAYAWIDLVRDGRTAWTGVRNYQARIHLNTMQPGDRVFFYESVTLFIANYVPIRISFVLRYNCAIEKRVDNVFFKVIQPLFSALHTFRNFLREFFKFTA